MTLLIVILAVITGQQAPPLRIVVIEGEGAVNIIQQKTAVSPLVEIRDRNDQPVAGAVVNFVIRNGRATFSGARAISVTTNAAGRAVATGFAPSAAAPCRSGDRHVPGQTAAAVTIAQTNVMTAAEAAAVSSASAGRRRRIRRREWIRRRRRTEREAAAFLPRRLASSAAPLRPARLSRRKRY